MKPLVPAMLVLVVSASIVLRKPPAAPGGPEPLPSPPPSEWPKPGTEAFAPRVSLLTSKSANKNRPSAWTRTFPGCVAVKKEGGEGGGG